jgi:hypothetical protein
MSRSSALSLLAAAALLLMATAAARADDVGAKPDPAAELRAKYVSLKEHLGHTVFERQLQMDSTEGANVVSGEIHAVIDHSFAVTGAALYTPSQWCDILILHLNTKYCRPAGDSRAVVLHVVIGAKTFQPVSEGFRVNLGYRVMARTADYLQVNLEASEGPLGTRDFRIVVAAMPADDGKTFIRLSYSYTYGTVARLAMQAYLATMGHDKVGFTVIGKEPDGGPHYVGGMRGVVERNTMRYYLAIESFLGSLSTPPAARMGKSLSDWFAATESYPRQLREIGRGEYLDMKRREYARQQTQS